MMKKAKATRRTSAQRAAPARADFAADLEGPSEIVSATVPKRLLTEVRSRVGRRGVSQFITRALAREIVRQNRERFIAELVDSHGPVDESLVNEWRALLSN